MKSTESGCPSGYKACSSQTANWWDRVCVPDSADIATACPILALEFVPTSQLSSYSNAWTKLAFVNNLAIVYTQTDSTRGPIGSTWVGRTPCLDPAQTRFFDEKDKPHRYPLEYDKGAS